MSPEIVVRKGSRRLLLVRLLYAQLIITFCLAATLLIARLMCHSKHCGKTGRSFANVSFESLNSTIDSKNDRKGMHVFNIILALGKESSPESAELPKEEHLTHGDEKMEMLKDGAPQAVESSAMMDDGKTTEQALTEDLNSEHVETSSMPTSHILQNSKATASQEQPVDVKPDIVASSKAVRGSKPYQTTHRHVARQQATTKMRKNASDITSGAFESEEGPRKRSNNLERIPSPLMNQEPRDMKALGRTGGSRKSESLVKSVYDFRPQLDQHRDSSAERSHILTKHLTTKSEEEIITSDDDESTVRTTVDPMTPIDDSTIYTDLQTTDLPDENLTDETNTLESMDVEGFSLFDLLKQSILNDERLALESIDASKHQAKRISADVSEPLMSAPRPLSIQSKQSSSSEKNDRQPKVTRFDSLGSILESELMGSNERIQSGPEVIEYTLEYRLVGDNDSEYARNAVFNEIGNAVERLDVLRTLWSAVRPSLRMMNGRSADSVLDSIADIFQPDTIEFEFDSDNRFIGNDLDTSPKSDDKVKNTGHHNLSQTDSLDKRIGFSGDRRQRRSAENEDMKSLDENEVMKRNENEDMKSLEDNEERKRSENEDINSPEEKEVKKRSENEDIKSLEQNEVMKRSEDEDIKSLEENEVKKRSEDEDIKSLEENEAKKRSEDEDTKSLEENEVKKRNENEDIESPEENEVQRRSENEDINSPEKNEIRRRNENEDISSPEENEVMKSNEELDADIASDRDFAGAMEVDEKTKRSAGYEDYIFGDNPGYIMSHQKRDVGTDKTDRAQEDAISRELANLLIEKVYNRLLQKVGQPQREGMNRTSDQKQNRKKRETGEVVRVFKRTAIAADARKEHTNRFCQSAKVKNITVSDDDGVQEDYYRLMIIAGICKDFENIYRQIDKIAKRQAGEGFEVQLKREANDETLERKFRQGFIDKSDPEDDKKTADRDRRNEAAGGKDGGEMSENVKGRASDVDKIAFEKEKLSRGLIDEPLLSPASSLLPGSKKRSIQRRQVSADEEGQVAEAENAEEDLKRSPDEEPDVEMESNEASAEEKSEEMVEEDVDKRSDEDQGLEEFSNLENRQEELNAEEEQEEEEEEEQERVEERGAQINRAADDIEAETQVDENEKRSSEDKEDTEQEKSVDLSAHEEEMGEEQMSEEDLSEEKLSDIKREADSQMDLDEFLDSDLEAMMRFARQSEPGGEIADREERKDEEDEEDEEEEDRHVRLIESKNAQEKKRALDPDPGFMGNEKSAEENL